jgi:hypothetical protein
MRNFIDAVMLMESDSPDGWWIDEEGTFLECDHRTGYHHSDLAIEGLGLTNEEDDEGDDAEWFLDYANQEALDRGWVRCSIYRDAAAIGWEKPLTQETKRVFLAWLNQYAPAFRLIDISAPSGDAHFEHDARGAIRFVRANL